MKRIRTVGLCLAAVFALSAVAVSSASAADLLARLPGGGSVAGVTFLSSATLPLLFTHSGKSMHCKHVTNHGLFLSATLGNVLIRFLGCTSKEGIVNVNCNTPGAGSGEIHLALSTLFHLGLAHLGTNRTIPAVAILPGKTIVIECSLVKIEVRGNVIGAFQLANGNQLPLNTSVSQMHLNFQQTANGLQHLRLILMPGSTTPTTNDWETSFSGGVFELESEVANATLDGFTTGGGVATNIELVEP